MAWFVQIFRPRSQYRSLWAWLIHLIQTGSRLSSANPFFSSNVILLQHSDIVKMLNVVILVSWVIAVRRKICSFHQWLLYLKGTCGITLSFTQTVAMSQPQKAWWWEIFLQDLPGNRRRNSNDCNIARSLPSPLPLPSCIILIITRKRKLSKERTNTIIHIVLSVWLRQQTDEQTSETDLLCNE